MELTSIVIFFAIIFLIFFLILLFSDADIPMMFYEKFGKPLSSVRGQVYWIVGASSGVGEYLAYELVANGAKVVLSARRESELEKVKTQCLAIGKKSGISEEDILLLPVDITNLDLHQQYFDAVISHFGTLDVLVNNAGRSQRATWLDINIQVDRDLFDTNVFGLVNLSRIVVPYFLSKKKGQVAVSSSVCGKMGPPCSATYNATKHALHGYFETLRSELHSQGVLVTMLCLGPFFSDILSACATGKPGEKLKGSMTQHDRRMTTDRCARLCLIAIVNKIDEAWISINPALLTLYAAQYSPTLFRSVMAKFGVRYSMKVRGHQD